MRRHEHNTGGGFGEGPLYLSVERRAIHGRHSKVAEDQIVDVHG